jgi:DNA-binding IclR family transcriptional regulator
LSRGLQILEFLVQEPEPQRASQIARATGLDRSAVNRLLRELENHALVSRGRDDARYRIGNAMVALSAVVMQRVDIRRLARPFMEELVRATGETISLNIRSGRNWVCIETCPSPQAISRVIPIGETVPLYAGPTSKAILAFLDQSEIESIVNEALAVDWERYRDIYSDLELVRANRYIALPSDRAPGVAGLSGPVFNAEDIVGAITVSGPSGRWTQEAMEAASGLLVAACSNLSSSLGYDPPRAIRRIDDADALRPAERHSDVQPKAPSKARSKAPS